MRSEHLVVNMDIRCHLRSRHSVTSDIGGRSAQHNF
jgi:hypothetical protein